MRKFRHSARAGGRRRRRRSKPGILFTLALFAGMVALAVWLEQRNPAVLEGRAAIADGDTLVVNGERVRLSGIDAPEFDQLCDGPKGRYACGREARRMLRNATSGQMTRCKTSGVDRYDRWLAICFAGGQDVNAVMVRDGWAVNTGGYGAEEQSARKHKRGIWAGAFETPAEYRRNKPVTAGEGEWLAALKSRLRSLGKRFLP